MAWRDRSSAPEPPPVQYALQLVIERTGSIFVISGVGKARGSGEGLTRALETYGRAVYKRFDSLAKLDTVDLSETAREELTQLEGVLGKIAAEQHSAPSPEDE